MYEPSELLFLCLDYGLRTDERDATLPWVMIRDGVFELQGARWVVCMGEVAGKFRPEPVYIERILEQAHRATRSGPKLDSYEIVFLANNWTFSLEGRGQKSAKMHKVVGLDQP